jgi:hypothetical protein
VAVDHTVATSFVADISALGMVVRQGVAKALLVEVPPDVRATRRRYSGVASVLFDPKDDLPILFPVAIAVQVRW